MWDEYDMGMTTDVGGFGSGPLSQCFRAAPIFLCEIKRWKPNTYNYSSDIEKLVDCISNIFNVCRRTSFNVYEMVTGFTPTLMNIFNEKIK